MEYRPEKLYRIVDQYTEEGYVEVPGYYEGNNRCRLCGWQNDSTFDRYCPQCKAEYERDVADKQFPLGFDWLGIEDWMILRAIEHQIQYGEQPYVTLEEFVENIKARAEHVKKRAEERHAKKMQPTHRNDSILYQHK